MFSAGFYRFHGIGELKLFCKSIGMKLGNPFLTTSLLLNVNLMINDLQLQHVYEDIMTTKTENFTVFLM